MYLALFLFPWMAMYALSTLVMNHRALFVKKFGAGPVPFSVERELTFDGSLPPNAEPRGVSRMILASLGLDGAHAVNRRGDGTLVINRHDLVFPRRITYTPSDQRLVIERMQYRTNALLERFHRLRGNRSVYGMDTVWAVSVDLVIVAMMFWVLSGLWMWWEMKVTRRLGALAALGGAGLFAFYLLAI